MFSFLSLTISQIFFFFFFLIHLKSTEKEKLALKFENATIPFHLATLFRRKRRVHTGKASRTCEIKAAFGMLCLSRVVLQKVGFIHFNRMSYNFETYFFFLCMLCYARSWPELNLASLLAVSDEVILLYSPHFRALSSLSAFFTNPSTNQFHLFEFHPFFDSYKFFSGSDFDSLTAKRCHLELCCLSLHFLSFPYNYAKGGVFLFGVLFWNKKGKCGLICMGVIPN